MTTSDRIDRKQRQVKATKRNGRAWAKLLVRPGTLKFLVSLGLQVTRVVWMICKIIKFLRE